MMGEHGVPGMVNTECLGWGEHGEPGMGWEGVW